MKKIWLIKKRIPIPHAGKIEDYEIIELHLDGKVVNRVKRDKYVVRDYIEDFYQRNPFGEAFIIRGSKMNFKSLIQQDNEP